MRKWLIITVVLGLVGVAAASINWRGVYNMLGTFNLSGKLDVLSGGEVELSNGFILDVDGYTVSEAELKQVDTGLLLKVDRDTCSVASLNAGRTLLADLTGRTITVYGVYVRAVTDSIEGLTAAVISDTHSSPVAILTVAAAELIPAQWNNTFVYDTGLTLGAGFGTALTAGKGLKITKTGGSATTDNGYLEIITFYSVSDS